jgi:hypothetical protein
MANCIVMGRGLDKNRLKETSRLGSTWVEAEANTWHTFVFCHVNADGSGFITVTRDGERIHDINLKPEK